MGKRNGVESNNCKVIEGIAGDVCSKGKRFRGEGNSKFIKRAGIKTVLVLLMCFIITSVPFYGCTNSEKFSGKNPGQGNGTNNSVSEVTTSSINQNGTSSSESGNTAASTGSTQSQTNQIGQTGETSRSGTDSTGSNYAPAVKVKALYLTGWTVGGTSKLNHYIELAKNTEINSYVVDIKDDDGYIGYKTSIPEAIAMGGWESKYNVDKVIKAFHDNNIHVIGRLVCFKDPVLSVKKPEQAIKDVNGGLWKDSHGKTWLDPYNKDNWNYIVKVAKEAIDKGFDEIQFDYVRFPSDGSKKAMSFGSADKKKYEVINEFLAYAKKELPGTRLSADVFGIICESPADSEGIGQYLELVGKDVDYLSPMVYPSHYASGQMVNGIKFAKPDFEPYKVVYNSLIKAKKRIADAGGFKAQMRPYLQDFTASWLKKGNYQAYGAEQVRQQIKAVYDAGYSEWILWDAANSYDETAFNKE